MDLLCAGGYKATAVGRKRWDGASRAGALQIDGGRCTPGYQEALTKIA